MNVNKPPVYSYGKAERRIAELEGQVIQLNLELQHLREQRNPKEPRVTYDGKLMCSKCDWPLAINEDAKEFAKSVKHFCPHCGTPIKW